MYQEMMEKHWKMFCSAFVDKDSEKIEQIFGDYLWNTISIRDTAVAKEKKENFLSRYFAWTSRIQIKLAD